MLSPPGIHLRSLIAIPPPPPSFPFSPFYLIPIHAKTHDSGGGNPPTLLSFSFVMWRRETLPPLCLPPAAATTKTRKSSTRRHGRGEGGGTGKPTQPCVCFNYANWKTAGELSLSLPQPLGVGVSPLPLSLISPPPRSSRRRFRKLAPPHPKT